MAIPNITDLTVFTGTPLTSTDWLNNFTKIVNYLADGTSDLNINSVTLTIFAKLTPLTMTQINALTPTEGTLVMNGVSHRPMFFDGYAWQSL